MRNETKLVENERAIANEHVLRPVIYLIARHTVDRTKNLKEMQSTFSNHRFLSRSLDLVSFLLWDFHEITSGKSVNKELRNTQLSARWQRFTRNNRRKHPPRNDVRSRLVISLRSYEGERGTERPEGNAI